jgi:hypothetical protein
MSRFVAALLFLSLGSFPSTSARSEAAMQSGSASTAVAVGSGNTPVQLVRHRYFHSSTSRRSGSYTPWYLLPKTDPRRFNGPRYYYR